MKRLCRKEMVHINRLSETLISKILEYLPIEDVVRNSIPSKKLRYAWTKRPRLVFDDESCQRLILKTGSKVIMAIYQVLLLHGGPLDLFELSLSNLKCSPEIDLIVLVVLKFGVTKFTLNMPEGEYRLPSSIFVYGAQLKMLDLRFCVLKPPMGFHGFSKLKDLYLTEVGISGGPLSSLISNSPLLETLVFKSFTNCGCLDIIAPNLEHFEFEGLCDSLCFKNTPQLIDVWINDNDVVNKDNSPTKGVPPSRCMLSGRLPVVNFLELDHVYSEHMAANKTTASLVNDLCHLEVLVLHMDFGFLDQVSTALFLVKNANNVEKLYIEVDSKTTGSDVELKQVKGFSDVTFENLEKFVLRQAFGSKCELQFIELILATSPELKFCIIQPNTELIGQKGWRFFQQLSTFRRASPHVKIAYEDEDED